MLDWGRILTLPTREASGCKAWKTLNALIPGLPETTIIVKSFAEILPAITKILGFAV